MALLSAVIVFSPSASSLHNISYAKLHLRAPLALNFGAADNAWADDSANPKAPVDSAADSRLKIALQKRLLIPNVADITLGTPSPGPMPGMTQRTVTVNNGAQGQKIQLELFLNATTDKGILAQRYALFDMADPWEYVDMKALHLDDRATLGPATAPVTIVEFADFECPFCARAFSEIETLVNTNYKDKVRLIWKNYPLNIHPWAQQAAIAAECSRQQNPDAFWTFARNLYRDQSSINPQNLRQHIDSYAGSLSLDGKALNACVVGNSAEARVDEDKKDAEAIRVNSTPTFLVNGIPVVGLPSGTVFDYVITSQLQQTRHASR